MGSQPYKGPVLSFQTFIPFLHNTTTTLLPYTLFLISSMRSLEIIVSLSLALGVSALAAPVNPRSHYAVRYSLYFLQLSSYF